MKTVVLTSTENFVWHSMQEIIPMIERSWLQSSSDHKHFVVSFDVGKYTLAQMMPALMQADQIVFTCFTAKLARLGELLRKTLNLQARYIIYLHNQATIGCWPYFVWGLGSVLKQSDVFVSSCRLDARALKLTFKNPKVLVVPFTLPEDHVDSLKNERKPVDFVFAGRVSEQKNLHALIQAFSIFKQRNPKAKNKLVIYGGEDHLGSPNMGQKSSNYRKTLERLCKSQGVTKDVVFKGYMQREQLHIELRRPHVFVSVSLHSDENFGMSALRSLAMGAPAVLTRWGGHADFPLHFKSRVFLVKAQASTKGPWTHPEDIVHAMEKALRVRAAKAQLPEYYHMDSIAQQLLEFSLKPYVWSSKPLSITALAQRVQQKRERFAKTSPTKIFKSYADKDSHQFFQAYGMT